MQFPDDGRRSWQGITHPQKNCEILIPMCSHSTAPASLTYQGSQPSSAVREAHQTSEPAGTIQTDRHHQESIA